MDCLNHPGTEGTATCTECGRKFCLRCVEAVAGKDVCHNCVTKIQQRLIAMQQGQIPPTLGSTPDAQPQGSAGPQAAPAPSAAAGTHVVYPPPNLGLGFAYGLAGALVGAAIWTAFTAVTGFIWGYIGAVVGILVGVMVRKGAGAPSSSGGWLGLVLAALALYLGMAGVLYFATAKLTAGDTGGFNQLPAVDRLVLVLRFTPGYIAERSPITWICLGFGLWRGWKTPQECSMRVV